MPSGVDGYGIEIAETMSTVTSPKVQCGQINFVFRSYEVSGLF